MTAIHPDYRWTVMTETPGAEPRREGDLYEDGEACINAAVDLIGCPEELRMVFMAQLLQGKFADDGKRKVWIEAVPR